MMETNRNIGSTISHQLRQSSQTDQSWNTYLTILAQNLSLRFPEVTSLDNIDVDQVRRIAEFSVVCSNIAVEVWQSVYSQESRQTRQQTRVA